MTDFTPFEDLLRGHAGLLEDTTHDRWLRAQAPLRGARLPRGGGAAGRAARRPPLTWATSSPTYACCWRARSTTRPSSTARSRSRPSCSSTTQTSRTPTCWSGAPWSAKGWQGRGQPHLRLRRAARRLPDLTGPAVVHAGGRADAKSARVADGVQRRHGGVRSPSIGEQASTATAARGALTSSVTSTATTPDRSRSPTAAAWGSPREHAAAFGRAAALGLTHLETDVRTTRDGHVVLLPRPALRRVTGHPGRVADLDLADLRRLRVGGHRPDPDAGRGDGVLPGREVRDRPQGRGVDRGDGTAAAGEPGVGGAGPRGGGVGPLAGAVSATRHRGDDGARLALADHAHRLLRAAASRLRGCGPNALAGGAFAPRPDPARPAPPCTPSG